MRKSAQFAKRTRDIEKSYVSAFTTNSGVLPMVYILVPSLLLPHSPDPLRAHPSTPFFQNRWPPPAHLCDDNDEWPTTKHPCVGRVCSSIVFPPLNSCLISIGSGHGTLTLRSV